MKDAFICDALRTPIGRYGGALSAVRADDLAAIPMAALMARYPDADWSQLDDCYFGCANQAGEDNRNVARMAVLLSGLGENVPAATVNRLCGSGMEAVGIAARAIKSGEASWAIAGGVESMSRAPFVLGKSDMAFSRKAEIFDTTIGWRFVNPQIQKQFGIDSMPETAELLAERWHISREAQDEFAFHSQRKAQAAIDSGRFASEITPVRVKRRKEVVDVDRDEHPRLVTRDALAKLPPIVHPNGTVTAGNASGINDGACAVLIADEATAKRYGLRPRARILGMATAGVPPRIMGTGPVPAVNKLLARLGLSLGQMDLLELNEAFAAQCLAVMAELGIEPADRRLNPNGGAIALGHPLGMSGARLLATAVEELDLIGARYGLCAMCIGVGQGVAITIERV